MEGSDKREEVLNWRGLKFVDARVQKVISLMKGDLHSELSSRHLAQHVNLSPSRLHQVFKEETGVPLLTYLRLLRMRQAKELLETTFLSVKQIMNEVGVADGSHFVRDFKRAYGHTPTQYRARVAKAHSASRNVSDLNGLLLLVVEDDQDTRELMTLILEQYGACVIAVDSASAALAALKQMLPHVMIADIGMLGEDGYALIRKVRALSEKGGGRIPAVAVTSFASAEDRKQALAAGFQIHMSKPTEPHELVAVIAKLTGRAEI